MSTVADINRLKRGANLASACGSARTLTHLDAGKLILLDTGAGSTVTLPPATGTQDVFEFATYTLATSNAHVVQVANATDVMSGGILMVDNADGTCTPFGCVAASDTLTLNRTSTGSIKVGGDHFWMQDVKAGFWMVWGVCTGTGSEATPFSAAVS